MGNVLIQWKIKILAPRGEVLESLEPERGRRKRRGIYPPSLKMDTPAAFCCWCIPSFIEVCSRHLVDNE
jgi:hypothetical protein